ncbi:Carbohydrate sulfotransferase 11 [Holothuria leucospilota]|uniref:Carbohydrate sulfotransferase n=1 Tax=Holothuria leucospilota TaxID=206669 RepID=A0A9Q1CNM0_HOLLE|nr:Carbohydrate sulfotransferase 11 [Holothuria leucospilota]
MDDVSFSTEALTTARKESSTLKAVQSEERNETKFKFVSRNSIEEEQKIRKNRINGVCQKEPELQGNLFYRDTFAHMYVIDKYKLLFCYIPKVGCSNWKRVLMVLSGRKKTIENITSHEAHAHNGLRLFRRLNNWQQKYALKNYRKVMFVREPFARILSAYKNKYGDLEVYRNAPPNFHIYATRIIRKYRENPSSDALLTGENITFAEFVEYLTDQRERPNFDRHWKEMYKLCSPCNVKYDFIGKLENLEEEANYVLGSVPGVRDIVSYPAKANSHPTNTSVDIVKETLSPFSDEKLLQLWDIYKLDFNLFGYDKPSFIP